MQSLDVASVTLIAGTGVAAGLVNAIAGGGSLISFPALVAAGLPAVTANITNTVALCPGYFGGVFGQRCDLTGQRNRVMMLLPTSLMGGVVGALLLLWTGQKAFDILVPFLLLFAVALLAFQNQLQAFMMARKHGAHRETWSIVPIGIAAIYGGYFGAALGVIVFAVLVVVIDDSLIRLNALKQLISLAVNVGAAVVFLFLGQIDWALTLVMAIAALVGGAIGGAIASRIPAKLFRWIVIVAGLGMSAVYFARLFN